MAFNEKQSRTRFYLFALPCLLTLSGLVFELVSYAIQYNTLVYIYFACYATLRYATLLYSTLLFYILPFRVISLTISAFTTTAEAAAAECASALVSCKPLL